MTTPNSSDLCPLFWKAWAPGVLRHKTSAQSPCPSTCLWRECTWVQQSYDSSQKTMLLQPYPARPCLHSPLGKSAAFKWWHADAVGLDFFNLVLLKNFSIYVLGLPASAAHPSIGDLSRITVGLQPSYFARICLPSFLNLHTGPHIMRVVLVVAFHFCYIPESLPIALKAESHIQGAFQWIYPNLFWDPTLPRILIDLGATPKRLFSIQNIFTPSVGNHFF